MKDIEILQNCILFKNIEKDTIEQILDHTQYLVKTYPKNDIVGIENNPCDYLGILISGELEIQKIFESGKSITLTRLSNGHIFGEAIIFTSKHNYPATVVATQESRIYLLSKRSIIDLCESNEIFLNNFLSLLSNKILMLNQKVRMLSFTTIRQKIASFILRELESQNNVNEDMIELKITKKALAEQLGIPRPSLSRELLKMEDENLLELKGKCIKVLDRDLLSESLYN